MIKRIFFILSFLWNTHTFAEDAQEDGFNPSVTHIGLLRSLASYVLDAALARAATGTQLREGLPSKPPVYRGVWNALKDRNAGLLPRLGKNILDNQAASYIISSPDCLDASAQTVLTMGLWQWITTPTDVIATKKILYTESWRIGLTQHLPSYPCIIRSLGPQYLFRGASMGVASSVVSWLAFIEYTKQFVVPKIQKRDYGYSDWVLTSLGAAGIEVMTYTPFWNLRTAMVQFPELSLWQIISERFKKQGVRGFYHGWQIGVIYAVTFSFMDYRTAWLTHQSE